MPGQETLLGSLFGLHVFRVDWVWFTRRGIRKTRSVEAVTLLEHTASEAHLISLTKGPLG
jgi:hypothetical protein